MSEFNTEKENENLQNKESTQRKIFLVQGKNKYNIYL